MALDVVVGARGLNPRRQVSVLRTWRPQGGWSPSKNRGISRIIIGCIGCGLGHVRCVDTGWLVRHKRKVEPTDSPMNNTLAVLLHRQ